MIKESTLWAIVLFIFVGLPILGVILRLAFLALFGVGYGVARAFGYQPRDRRLDYLP